MVLSVAGSARAQSLRITGRIARGVTADSTEPVPAAWAVLHAVSGAGGAPIDSQLTDARGRYRLTARMPDSSAIYLVSTAWRGITYFSEAVVPGRYADSVETLVVFDTSSASPAIRVTQRHIVVRVPDRDGGRRTLELLTLANRGVRTRVSADGVAPVWVGRLPNDVIEFEVGESEVSGEAIARLGDSVIVTAPIPPGDKQVLYTYVVPRDVDELRVEIGQHTDRLLVLLEDTAATQVGSALIPRGIEVFDDAQFALYEGVDLVPGTQVLFAFGGDSGVSTQQLLAGLIGLSAALMTLSLIVWWRRREPVPVAVPPEVLARDIAAMDRAFEVREAATPEETARYREERARLKQQLAAALARRQHDV